VAASGSEVRFTGHLPAAELATLRAEAAVVLVPSRWEEPCPYSALDALAAGVPVLAGGLGGLPELVGEDGVVGRGTAVGSVEAWAAALGELWRDPELRLARGRAGLERARERFGEDRYHEGLMQVYSGE
jgi:glycosyltransferase involved in cell wall biosynthesis